MVAAFPRTPDFKEDIIQAFYDGIKHKPDTTFGNVKADVIADKEPHFRTRQLLQRHPRLALARWRPCDGLRLRPARLSRPRARGRRRRRRKQELFNV